MSRLPDGYDVAEEAGFIRDEGKWPLWPVLPVKRVDGSGDIGIVLATQMDTVILMNMLELKTGPVKEQIVGKDALVYESVEAMVADGWIGD